MSTRDRTRDLLAATQESLAGVRKKTSDPGTRFELLIVLDLLDQLGRELAHSASLDEARSRAGGAELAVAIRERSCDLSDSRRRLLESMRAELGLLRPRFDISPKID